MKKIFEILKRDLKSGTRDSMILYILVVPFLIAVVLYAVTGSVSESGLTLLVPESLDSEETEYLEKFAKVTVVASEDAVAERVLDLDDVYGVLKKGDGYEVVAQGNEKINLQETVRLLLDGLKNRNLEAPVEVSVTDVGWKLSPIKQFGGGLLVVFISVFGGMIIMINLVEEKQENTLLAMNVSPVTRPQYLMGKALLGFLIPLIHVMGILLILDYGDINYLMAGVMTLSIALISVIMGFAIGVNSDNILAAISGMKMIFLPILGSVFGAIYLRESLHVLLYWSPFYWAFKSINEIILKEAVWGDIFISLGMILFIAAVLLLFMKKKIRRGLR